MLELTAVQQPVTLFEPMRYATSAGGKKLRPILLLICCEAVGGDTRAGLEAAVSLELVHNFTLVHDDIMDNDDLRRGRETVHKHWDKNIAILVGDGLLVLAYSELARMKSDKFQQIACIFSDAILKVCEGQALDKEFEQRESISMAEYLDMIDKKTAMLFSMACQVGAMLGGGSKEQIDAMGRYGHLLGRAFQIQDDLLDLIADESILGKDIGSDLMEHKKTFLVIHALENAPAHLLPDLKGALQKKSITSQDCLDIKHKMQEIGTIKAAQDQIALTLNRALASLKIIPHNTARSFLVELLDLIAQRNS